MNVCIHSDQKSVSDALELELQVAVNHPMEVARELNLGLLEKQKALLTAKIFLQLPSLVKLESTKGENKTKQSKNQPHILVYIRQIKYYLNSYSIKFQCRFSLSN